jgi:hypothetical protein
MKNNIQRRPALMLMTLVFLIGHAVYSQESIPSYQPFQIGIGLGGSLKGGTGSAGFGMGVTLEPRYFINKKWAITGRAQAYDHLTLGLEPGSDNHDISVVSYLAGVLMMNREQKNPFFWGINTGIAITEEVTGLDEYGYAILGEPVTYWAFQPRAGKCFGRFEADLSYHYASSPDARFMALTLGYHFWGNRINK